MDPQWNPQLLIVGTRLKHSGYLESFDFHHLTFPNDGSEEAQQANEGLRPPVFFSLFYSQSKQNKVNTPILLKMLEIVFHI